MGGGGFNRFEIDLALALAGQKNNWRLATSIQSRAQKGNSILGSEPVIDQANVVLAASHHLHACRVVVEPFQFEPPALDFSKQAAGQDIIILIILDEQDSQPFRRGVRSLHYFLTGNSTISN